MIDLEFAARVLLAVFCAIQGLATIVMDLNRSHAAHPQWLGHARFHVVWQTATVATLATVEVCLVLASGPFASERFYLTALLASAPMAGFFAALATRHLYGGTLSDPGGIAPLRLKLRGMELQIDLNAVCEVAGVVFVAALVWLHHWARSRS